MANLSEFQQGQWAVGSIQQSMLDEADFQTEMGPNWVLCDGGDITGSKLATYIGNTLPDCSDRFLRSNGVGNSAAMRTQQGEETKKNSLTVSNGTTKFAKAGHTHASNTGSHSHSGLAVTGGGNTFFLGYSTNAASGLRKYNSFDLSSSSSSALAYHVTEANGNIGTTSGGSSTSNTGHYGYADTTLNNGGDETRPVNITVNTYIKIN